MADSAILGYVIEDYFTATHFQQINPLLT